MAFCKLNVKTQKYVTEIKKCGKMLLSEIRQSGKKVVCWNDFPEFDCLKIQKRQNMILEILQFRTKTPTYDIET